MKLDVVPEAESYRAPQTQPRFKRSQFILRRQPDIKCPTACGARAGRKNNPQWPSDPVPPRRLHSGVCAHGILIIAVGSGRRGFIVIIKTSAT